MGLFFDHPRPVKVQGAVPLFSFLRVFVRFWPDCHRRGRPISFNKDMLCAPMWARDVANRCSILNGSREFPLKRTKTSC